ncbi:MAG: hypothetical protein ABI045_02265 [Flavobacteriales bacterium]
MFGIEVAEEIFPKMRQVTIFDTIFHHSLPEKAYRYTLPDKLYTIYHVHTYDFYSISHRYLTQQAMEYLKNY